MSQVSLDQIAKRVGVSRSTVSRALRGNTRISKQVRQRVREVAESLGWTYDPFLSVSQSRLRKVHGGRGVYAGTIGYLYFREDGAGARSYQYNCSLEQGAQQRAQQLDYKIDVIVGTREAASIRRAAAILRARGITGVIVAPLERRIESLPFEWEDFASVAIGDSIESPALHRCMSFHAKDMAMLISHLRALSYARIGLVLRRNIDDRLAHHWLGIYLGDAYAESGRIPIPPLLLADPGKLDESKVLRWMEKRAPHAVITHSVQDAQTIERLAAACGHHLTAWPLLIPESESCPLGGIAQNATFTGANAVDLVVSQIHRGEKGVPHRPKLILSEGVFRPRP